MTQGLTMQDGKIMYEMSKHGYSIKDISKIYSDATKKYISQRTVKGIIFTEANYRDLKERGAHFRLGTWYAERSAMDDEG